MRCPILTAKAAVMPFESWQLMELCNLTCWCAVQAAASFFFAGKLSALQLNEIGLGN